MESVELKMRGIDNSDFVLRYTKKIVDMLGEPEMSIEMNAGPISEEVSRLLESLGYRIISNKPTGAWTRVQAVKAAK